DPGEVGGRASKLVPPTILGLPPASLSEGSAQPPRRRAFVFLRGRWMALSILLVDADTNHRRALRVALHLEGVHVGEAESLAEAQRAVTEGAWNCVVVDLLLPLAEGRRALELLRESGVTVIGCSAHPELLAMAAREMEVLAKPL